MVGSAELFQNKSYPASHGSCSFLFRLFAVLHDGHFVAFLLYWQLVLRAACRAQKSVSSAKALCTIPIPLLVGLALQVLLAHV